MIYPDSFEKKLGFDKIRDLIKKKCISALGEEWIDKIAFSTKYNQVCGWLEQTNEMLMLAHNNRELPVSTIIDVRAPLKKIMVEGMFMDVDELFDLHKNLSSIKLVTSFIRGLDSVEYPRLTSLSSDVMVYPAVTDKIETVLNRQGKIKDNASPELARLRSAIINLQQSVSKRMNSILREVRSRGLIDSDVSVTMRDGRPVIPVPSANKRKVPGIVHDESATGKTTYIEPSEIVEVNNELRELRSAERREIVRILIEVSDFIRPYIDDIFYSVKFLGVIDFIRAKARFAHSIEGIIPEVRNNPAFHWIEARHPLLYLQHKAVEKEVVPLSLQLTPDDRIVLISGPNAGGKSVCLQTAGLLQYMLQCGLPVPLLPGSNMGFFENIFLDLGDEQSIENDLSTYSSHLNNMKNFVRYCNNKSLLLIDEFGTGTEPMLGGAIAESVLEQLNYQGVYGVITTHYTNLKHYASQTDGIVNGAMLFDTHELKPLFRLQIGQPGSSFAFEIARKIGLPETILATAKERLGEDHIHFDKHLREIIRDKRYWEQKRRNIKLEERKLETVTQRYEKELEQLNQEKLRLLKNAKEEASLILNKANKKIENTIREIRESQADKERTRRARKDLETFKDDVVAKDIQEKQGEDKIAAKIEKIKRRKKSKEEREGKKEKSDNGLVKVESSSTIEVGDSVSLESGAMPGEVLEIKDKKALVAFGDLITNVAVSRLQKISKKRHKQSLKKGGGVSTIADRIREKKIHFKSDIDIRGMRADDAINHVVNHLDEAVMCGAETVKILHGKGNGILRALIREHLSVIPFVKSFRDENIQMGGSGITVVELE
ncbi:Smr/MutS family protein [Marinilabiliaceae bacterium ANBcel2]|nr:Smr/MutS family protein [Marinilabiliaceae bacterium ANBcel2]